MRRILEELRVRDLGVIDDVTVPLGPGMTALTGETGAGKTLLVEALSLLVGGRTDPSLVRAGSAEAVVEARFAAPDGGGDGPGDGDNHDARGDGGTDGGEVVLSRTVVAGGRSRAHLDGRMATAAAVAEAGGALLELHGQHQHRSLVHAAAQRDALDRYAEIDLTALHRATATLRALEAEREELGGDALRRAREADLLRYQVEEIEGAALDGPDEDDRLEQEEDRLAEVGAHREAAAAALDALAGTDVGSAVDRLAEVSAALAGRAPLAELDRRTRAAMAELTDLAGELRSVADTWDEDPERLAEVRARRQLIHELLRKYGATLEEVVAFGDAARAELAAIAQREARSAEVDAAVEAARTELAGAQAEVAAARRAAAPVLAAEIEATLRTLAMPSARFEVEVAGEGPADQITFGLGANPGEPLLPLAKVASGGELARTMLAVRLVLTAGPGVLVFDEVDAGIGGATATAVGEALAALGRSHQVLVVTHLAQVAALADHHLAVRKVEAAGRTRSEVTVLEGDDRVVEVSRMLSGSPDSPVARDHARELLGLDRGRRAAARR